MRKIALGWIHIISRYHSFQHSITPTTNLAPVAFIYSTAMPKPVWHMPGLNPARRPQRLYWRVNKVALPMAERILNASTAFSLLAAPDKAIFIQAVRHELWTIMWVLSFFRPQQTYCTSSAIRLPSSSVHFTAMFNTLRSLR
jgi:hypothetical protein